MNTIELSQAEMEARVARYQDLQPIPIQQDASVPQEANDLVYARELLSVIGLESAAETPINAGAPITGAGGMTMTLARCPPGQGPALHSHNQTYETFTVLQGRFEVTWNDDGRDTVVLEPFDTISVPPKVCRAFRNVGDAQGVLQVIITGGVHDMNDIDMVPAVGRRLEALGVRDRFDVVGLTFTAAAEDTAE